MIFLWMFCSEMFVKSGQLKFLDSSTTARLKGSLIYYLYCTIYFSNCQGQVLLTVNRYSARHLHSRRGGGNSSVTSCLLRVHPVTIVLFGTPTCTDLRIHFVHNLLCVVEFRQRARGRNLT